MITTALRFGLPTLLAASGLCQPLQACITFVPRNPDDIRYADVVVIGKITNYHIVFDQSARENRRRMLEMAVNMPNDLRTMLEKQTSFLSDYAQFDVIVDRVLRGKPQTTITVTWNNSTFGEPATMPPGPYLIALRRPSSATPPLRGPSATVLPLPKQTTFTPVQAPCSSPFIMGNKADQDDAVRRLSSIKPAAEDSRPVR